MELNRLLEFMNPLEVIVNHTEDELMESVIPQFNSMGNEERQLFLEELGYSIDLIRNRHEYFLNQVLSK